MCGPKFCSMKISQDIRKEASLKNQGYEKMSKEFRKKGALYIKKK